MTTNTIFPFSVPDTDLYILYKMDANSLVNMTAVSKLAKAVLDNDKFFKPFFSGCYPKLEEFKDKLFVTLRKWHPDTCWKVVCDAFEKALKNEKFEFTVSPSFCKVTSPQIRKVLESKIEEKQAKLKEICGSRCEDPNSPIDKAWKAWDSLKRELEQLTCRLNVAVEPFRERGIDSRVIWHFAFQLYREKSQIKELLLKNGNKPFTLTLDQYPAIQFEHGQFENLFHSLIEIFEHVHKYNYDIVIKSDSISRDWYSFVVSDKEIMFENAYHDLEASRQALVIPLDRYKIQLKYLELPIESFPENTQGHAHAIVEQARALRRELACAFFVHIGINDDRFLSQCLEKIDNYLTKSDPDVDSLKKIRSLINASSQSADIWKGLWLEKAKNGEGGYIIEDSWAEHHFHEFLPALRKIVLGCWDHAVWSKEFNLSYGTPKYLQD